MLTSSTLHNEPTLSTIYVDAGRKTEKKPNKFEANEAHNNAFCIPETPRPNLEKKAVGNKRTNSMDFFRGNAQSFKV